MKILIGADFVPTKRNYNDFSNHNLHGLIGEELCEVFSKADYRIFNLEMPLTDNATPISKCGPNLRAPTSTITGYKTAKIDLLTLANNHIMDYGIAGLQSTMNVLEKNRIHYVGAGMNLAAAKEAFLIDSSKKLSFMPVQSKSFLLRKVIPPVQIRMIRWKHLMRLKRYIRMPIILSFFIMAERNNTDTPHQCYKNGAENLLTKVPI